MRSQTVAARKQGGHCWALLPCWSQPAWPFPLSGLLFPAPLFLSAFLPFPLSQALAACSAAILITMDSPVEPVFLEPLQRACGKVL